MASIEVGKKFPFPIENQSVYWDISSNLLVLTGPRLSAVSDEELQVDRVWISVDGPVIVLTVTTPSMTAHLPATWYEGFSRPGWVDQELEQGGRLLLTVVWVKSENKTVRKMQAFTLSPHATKTLREQARRRWVTPLSEPEALQALYSWSRRHPTDKQIKQAAIASSRAGQ